MSKYKVLESNQNFMVRLGIHSHSLDSQTNEFFKSIPAYLIVSITIIFTIISSFVFICKNITNYESVIDAAMCGFAGVQGVGMFISIGLNMMNIKTLHLKLQEIIDSGKFNWIIEIKCLIYIQKNVKYFYLVDDNEVSAMY